MVIGKIISRYYHYMRNIGFNCSARSTWILKPNVHLSDIFFHLLLVNSIDTRLYRASSSYEVLSEIRSQWFMSCFLTGFYIPKQIQVYWFLHANSALPKYVIIETSQRKSSSIPTTDNYVQKKSAEWHILFVLHIVNNYAK